MMSVKALPHRLQITDQYNHIRQVGTLQGYLNATSRLVQGKSSINISADFRRFAGGFAAPPNGGRKMGNGTMTNTMRAEVTKPLTADEEASMARFRAFGALWGISDASPSSNHPLPLRLMDGPAPGTRAGRMRVMSAEELSGADIPDGAPPAYVAALGRQAEERKAKGKRKRKPVSPRPGLEVEHRGNCTVLSLRDRAAWRRGKAS